MHPIADSVPINLADAVHIDRIPRMKGSSAFPLIERLTRRHSSVMIGTLDGEASYVLGQVGDAVFLTDGSLAVLDQQSRVIRRYDSAGSYVGTAGGGGDGPGEFDAPLAMMNAGASELWVIDGAQMIHQFSSTNGTLAFRDRVAVDRFPRDACVLHDRIVLHAPGHVPNAGMADVLFRLDSSGSVQDHFSNPYNYSHFFAASRLRRGSVICAEPNLVLLAFEAQNRLDAYRIDDGALVWHATFDGLRIPKIRETELPDGRRSLEVDVREESFTHLLLGMSGGGAMPVVVQYARRLRDDIVNNRNRYIIDTYVVDPRTGRGSYVGEEIPQILAISHDRVALLHPDPFPQIEIAYLGMNSVY